jgi:hypothetical protein
MDTFSYRSNDENIENPDDEIVQMEDASHQSKPSEPKPKSKGAGRRKILSKAGGNTSTKTNRLLIKSERKYSEIS